MSLIGVYRTVRTNIEHIRHHIWKKQLDQRDFTIISNNCWGGTVSQYLGVEYKSPTVGLMFFPEDYLKFCADIKNYLDMELTFIKLKDSKMSERFHFAPGGEGDFPVGVLGDIEIYFMHYASQQEAYEKWNRRKNRINWDKMLYKLSERDGITEDQLWTFAKIPHKKVIFTQKRYENMEGAVYTPGLEQADKIGASEVGVTLKACNIVKIINGI